MVSVCLPSDALLQHLPSYLGFSYLGCGVSLHSCSSNAQPLLISLDEGYLLTSAPPDLELGVAPLGPPVPAWALLLGGGVTPLCRACARHSCPRLVNIHWIIKKATGFLKNIYFCFIDYIKALDCVDHSKL